MSARSAAEIAEPWLREQLAKAEELPEPEVDPEEELQRRTNAHAAELQRKRQQRLAELDAMGIPFRHAMALAAGHVLESEAVATYRKWIARGVYGSLLVLSGDVNSGKTFAASMAVIEGPPREYPFGDKWPAARRPCFIDAAEIMAMGHYDRERFTRLCECSVLGLDDLGVEFVDAKGAFRTSLDRLLNARYNGPCWTVITTNLSRTDFAKRYGDRLMGRLTESGSGFKHISPEQDFRGGKPWREWTQPRQKEQKRG